MEKIRPFGNWSPCSVTYDMFGNGKTVGASCVYYYKTRETLADNLSGLFTVTRADLRSHQAMQCTATSC